MKGKCSINNVDDHRFIEIEQNGTRFHCLFGQSQNGKFIVAWQMSLNPLQDKNKQVCLIENGNYVVWSEEFELVETCRVSDDGTVVALIHNMVPVQTANNLPGFIAKNSIVIIPKGQSKRKLEFSTREEVFPPALAISQNGDYLVYNLQQYNPDEYQIVLHNIHKNREEWRYKYSKRQAICDLLFKNERILVYASRRPTLYDIGRYSFTLDLTGRLVPDDSEEIRKQEERDSIAKKMGDYSSQASSILSATLEDIVPTIETADESSRSWKEIMSGNRSLPALHITFRPVPEQFSAELTRVKMDEKGYRFFLHIHVFARTEEERNAVSKDCVQILRQQKDSLEKKGLVFETRLHSRNIGFYPGSGPYFRTDIGCIVNFPAKQQPRKGEKLEDVFKLQAGESVVTMNDVLFQTSDGIRFEAKLILTTKKLYLFVKNPVSGLFSASSGLSREQAKKISFGDDDGKYLQRNEIRVYFKDQEDEFETFKKKFESWIR